MLDTKLSFHPGRHVAVANYPSIPRFSALDLALSNVCVASSLFISALLFVTGRLFS